MTTDKMLNIFIVYTPEDRNLLDELKMHLSPLRRQGLIAIWPDRGISAGTEWEQEIHKRLSEAHIILLLISPVFMVVGLVKTETDQI